MSLLRQSLIVLLLAIGAVGGWYGWQGRADEAAAPGASRAQQPPAPAPVVVEAVRFASDAAIIEAIGTGTARRAVELTPEAAGRVVAILFEAGERVAADAPLLHLDAEDERLALRLAEVTLDAARQQLERYERAAPSGAVSAAEVDAARTALDAAKIEVQQAELALAERTLRAPFAGKTGIPTVDVGDRVGEMTVVGTLDDVASLLVDFEVPEAFLAGVRRGASLELATWAWPGERFEGIVAAIGSRVDPIARTLPVRAEVDNGEGLLKPGMSFTVRLPLAGERFPSVPSIAVRWEREGAFVWRVVEGRAERVSVDVLKRSDGWVLVDAALEAGDRVVVEGLQRLRPGRAVEIVGGAEVAMAEPAGGG
jgi:RND family efflux transporter MFP subunit